MLQLKAEFEAFEVRKDFMDVSALDHCWGLFSKGGGSISGRGCRSIF